MRNRIVVSLLCWLTSAYGIYLSVEQIVMAVKLTLLDSTRFTPIYSLLFLGIPWVALAVMNLNWIKNRRVHWLWVGLGTITGAGGILLSFGLGLALAPLAFALAVFLAYFHLFSDAPRKASLTLHSSGSPSATR
jgi:hypothetical protein